MNTEIYTTRQAAKILGIHFVTLTRMVRKHDVPHYRAGRYILLDTTQLETVRGMRMKKNDNK